MAPTLTSFICPAHRLLLHFTQLARQQNPNRPNLDSFSYLQIEVGGNTKESLQKLGLDGSVRGGEEEEGSFVLLRRASLASVLYPEGDEGKLEALLASCRSPTIRADLLRILLRLAVLLRASQEGIGTVFLEDSCSQLAVEIMAATCTGRGEALPWVLHVPHQLYQLPSGRQIKVIRPLRELVSLEVSHYLALETAPQASQPEEPDTASIFGLSDRFIKSLDEENSATVSTVLRTAQKLSGDRLDMQRPCALCRAPRPRPVASSAEEEDGGREGNVFCYACREIIEDMDGDSCPHLLLPPIIQDALRSLRRQPQPTDTDSRVSDHDNST